MLKKTTLSLAVFSALSFTGFVQAQNYTQSSNYSDQAVFGPTSSGNSNQTNNTPVFVPTAPTYTDQAVFGPTSSRNNNQTNNNTPVFGPTAPSNNNQAGIINENALDPTGSMNTQNWVVAPAITGNPTGYNVNNEPKAKFVDQKTAMDNWTFSKLHCNQITKNLHFKGLADYLPLWNPPVDSIDDISYQKVPLFAMTDLIYNNINYGKGAVLLGSATIRNDLTGNINSQMSNAPVTVNNCNITWVIPDSIIAQLEEQSKQYSEDGGRNGFSSEAVEKLNADSEARQQNARANGISVPYKVYSSTGYRTR